jgi:hypothetical protein
MTSAIVDTPLEMPGMAVCRIARDSWSPGRRLGLPSPAMKIASSQGGQAQRACIWPCDSSNSVSTGPCSCVGHVLVGHVLVDRCAWIRRTRCPSCPGTDFPQPTSGPVRKQNGAHIRLLRSQDACRIGTWLWRGVNEKARFHKGNSDSPMRSGATTCPHRSAGAGCNFFLDVVPKYDTRYPPRAPFVRGLSAGDDPELDGISETCY